MDTRIIVEVSNGTLAGTLSFPDAVGRLMAAGVEYYHVDYATLRVCLKRHEGPGIRRVCGARGV